MMKPTIDSVIADVLKATQRTEPGEIADEIVRQIKPQDYTVYLKQLILPRLSSVAGREREKVNPLRKGLSTKQRLIREGYWPQFLLSKVATPSGYKTMGELTVDDLVSLAAVRRSQAVELSVKADQFERLAEIMQSAGVKVLEQLSPSDGERVLAA